LRLITIMTQAQSAALPWTTDRPVAEASNCTTHNIHRRQTSMPPAGFEPTIPASERPTADLHLRPRGLRGP